ncbi:MAG: hypothetical protein H6617_11795 [Bdellovibrionaceae bacterium]|nr:hypothetical protein [Bdellovibrionales bacterium]MCB9255355.1 hypothetical protein [Pseudobdellovibrionaceae bacterium]
MPLRFFIFAALCLSSAVAENFLPTYPTGSLTERYRAADFLVLLELDPLPVHIIQWNKTRSELLYVEDGAAKIIFSGNIKKNYYFYFNNKKVPLRDGQFNFKFRVPLETTPIPIKIVGPNGRSSEYRLLNHWLNIPPKLKFKEQKEEENTEASFGLRGIFKPSAFVQLYAEGLPTQLVDLDTQQHSKLTFRILTSVNEVYDGWVLLIRDRKGRVRAKVGRFGSPPDFIDWREISSQMNREGEYTYQVNLYYEGRLYEGKISEFRVIAGQSVLPHKYSPWLTIQPEGGFGFLVYRDQSNNTFSRAYMNFDFPFILFNRFIARIGGFATLHEDGSDDVFTFTRFGGGIRLFAGGRDTFFGDVWGFRLDTTLNVVGFTVSGDSVGARRIRAVSLLVEPHLLLWSYHYVIPWVELGFNSDDTHQHISWGVNYIFFIRPWSVNVGFGIAKDTLIKYTTESARFDVFRTTMKLIWFM